MALELFCGTNLSKLNMPALNVQNYVIYDKCIFELYKVIVTSFNLVTLLLSILFLKFFITTDV